LRKFPVDAPKARVLRALDALGFRIVREEQHIALRRDNPDGSTTPMTIPNHPTLKASTPRAVCSQAGRHSKPCSRKWSSSVKARETPRRRIVANAIHQAQVAPLGGHHCCNRGFMFLGADPGSAAGPPGQAGRPGWNAGTGLPRSGQQENRSNWYGFGMVFACSHLPPH
jgi:hypothetical protein